MKWRLTNKDVRCNVQLPDVILDQRPLDIHIGDESYVGTWSDAHQVLSLAAVDTPQVECNYSVRQVSGEVNEGDAEVKLRLTMRLTTGRMSPLTVLTEPMVPGADSRKSRAKARIVSLKSPMAGSVLKVMAKDGEVVQKGQIVCIIEAMKMENQIKAPESGVVSRLQMKPGDAVQAMRVLTVVTPET